MGISDPFSQDDDLGQDDWRVRRCIAKRFSCLRHNSWKMMQMLFVWLDKMHPWVPMPADGTQATS